jgi:hypothetical protein
MLKMDCKCFPCVSEMRRATLKGGSEGDIRAMVDRSVLPCCWEIAALLTKTGIKSLNRWGKRIFSNSLQISGRNKVCLGFG